MERIRVVVQASDPLSGEGLASFLQARPEFTVLPASEQERANVPVVSWDRLTAEVLTAMRRSAAATRASVVLVLSEISELELLAAVECRVMAILPRSAVTGDRLAHSVIAAASGGGVMPPNLVGELLKNIERLQREVLNPNGFTASGLTTREVDVLRLMADGLDTNEIAVELSYSERTVKNILYGATNRLKLRNRSHAVAYALRSGMI